VFEFEFDGELMISEQSDKVYDVNAQVLYDKAVKWGLVIEKLQDCLTRLKAVETALDDSWDGAASLKMQETVRQAEARLTYVIELLDIPTALYGCVGKALKEFQAEYKKIPFTLWYYPKYGDHIYTYGAGTVPDTSFDDEYKSWMAFECVTRR
jgi:uncharacterized protein YukE